MDKNEVKKITKKLQKQPKHTLKMERQELQDIQKCLRIKEETLKEHKDRLRDNLNTAYKAGDGDSITLLEHQIKDIKEEITEISMSYKENSEILEIYSKVLKNDADGRASNVGAIVGAVSGLGALGLGAMSLRKAYKTDVEGTMKNKGVLDFFYRLNPLRILGNNKK